MEDEITLETLQSTVESLQKEGTNETKLIRIPPKLYQANPQAFIPQLVSIGPFHHLGHNFNRFKDVNILAMEGKKRMYMLSLLQKYKDIAESKLEACKNILKEKSREICKCYAGEIDMSEDLLVKIMLVDGCFILGLLLAKQQMRNVDRTPRRYVRDLALLENQIPFFVLQELFRIFLSEVNLTKELLQLFRLTPESPPLPPDPLAFKHLLDLVSKCHRSNDDHRLSLTYGSKWIHLMNATKLLEAGVTFQSVSGTKLLNIQFWNGVLKFPPLIIHDSTEIILTNLVAYEHLSPLDTEYFTSYIVLMSLLIKSPEDFQVLEKQGILVNELGSREDASKIFSNICKQFVIKDFYYSLLCYEVEEYVYSRPRRYMQDLKRRCCDSPWTMISVVAATVLLILNAVQTIFTVLSYYQP